MNDILSQIEELLRSDERLTTDDGILLKNKVHELANKSDVNLIRLLLSNEKSKQLFFQDLTDTYVFDKEAFIRFVSNKNFLPDSYTSYKNKVGLADGSTFIANMGSVVLSWPYKDCVLEGGQVQESAPRNEVFWNRTIAPSEIERLLEPKTFTSISRYSAGKEVKVGAIGKSDSFVIKGNNLLTLHSLSKRYHRKIDLIYIDPPYNTGGSGDTFSYNNTFKHSTWYTFMKNRLDISRELLADSGFIAIAIDHFELCYLGVLADEIFGRENRIGIVSVVHKPEGRNQEKFFATSNEFMLVYAKDKSKANFNSVVLSDEKLAEYNEADERGRYKLMNYLRSGGGDDNLRTRKPNFWYPIYVSGDNSKISTKTFAGATEVWPVTTAGQERTWKTKADTLSEMIDEGRILARVDLNGVCQVFEKYYSDEKGQLVKTHWIDTRYNAINHGTKVVEELIGSKEFSYPKSVFLVQDVVKIMCPKDGIVLDYFGGSGTTAQAVLDLNAADGGSRTFILCEQMDYVESVTLKRLRQVATNNRAGDFIYMELASWNERWVRKIAEAKNAEALAKIWSQMESSAFLSSRIDPKSIDINSSNFESLSITHQKMFLMECLELNHLYLNYYDIEDSTYDVSKTDLEFNNSFYTNIE
jgi:adenine-specific DNA-methyltransferase